jgi:hypothetical protein
VYKGTKNIKGKEDGWLAQKIKFSMTRVLLVMVASVGLTVASF